MEESVFDPTIPYIGPIYSGQFNPGKVIKIQGTIPASAYRFNIALQCGPETAPRDDVALQMTVRLLDGYVSLNTLKDGMWGEQQRGSAFSVKRGQDFEIAFICDYNQYKVLINGQHYCLFPKRIPHDYITHLAIEGDISVAELSYESSHGTQLVEGPQFSSEAELDVVKLIDASPLPELHSEVSVNEPVTDKKWESGIQEFAIAEAVPLTASVGDGIPPNSQKYETIDRYYWQKWCALFWGVIVCIVIIFAIVITQAEKHVVLVKLFNSTSNETFISNTTLRNNNETFTNSTYFDDNNIN